MANWMIFEPEGCNECASVSRLSWLVLAKETLTRIMPTLIAQPTRVEAAGSKPKVIEEFVGRVNSNTEALSVAHMRSPEGWVEPGQTPEFDEYTVVLKGFLRVTYQGGSLEVRPGQAVIAHRGEWVQYSTPEGAEYIAICLPAFSPKSVHRDYRE
jgi:ethanolamine utilization protein EutQ